MRPGEPLYQRGPSGGDGGDGRRFFLAIALSVGLVWVYMTFLAPRPPQVETPAEGPEPATAGEVGTPTPLADETLGDDDSAGPSRSDGVVGEASAGGYIVDRIDGEPDTRTVIVDGFYQATFSDEGGGPQSWILDGYYEEMDLPWIPSWLWNGIKSGGDFEPFSLACPERDHVELIDTEYAHHIVPSFQSRALVHEPGGSADPGVRTYTWAGAREPIDWRRWDLVEESSSEGHHLVYRSRRLADEENLEITVTYDLPEQGYLIDYRVAVKNVGDQREELAPRFSVIQPIAPAASRYGSSTTPFQDKGGKAKDWPIAKIDKKRMIRDEENLVRFAGITDRYFMTALVPAEQPVAYEAAPIGWIDAEAMDLLGREPPVGMDEDPPNKAYRSTLLLADRSLGPNETANFEFKVYIGPKVLSDMKELELGLEDTVQYGVFSIIARPMLFLMTLFHSWVGSWGLAIILLTVVVKLLVFPLDQASYKSMKKMRVLAPRMQEIRDQFKDDPQRQQQEIMAMYKEAGANPFSGCFPMLIQMPIWFALYRVLWGSIELYQEQFLYFCDLTVRDPICIFPIALSGIMFVQQKMSPPPTDPNQKMMMQFMPLFFAFIMFALPSGLVVYILVSSCLRLLQQWFVNRSGDPESEKVAAAGKQKGK